MCVKHTSPKIFFSFLHFFAGQVLECWDPFICFDWNLGPLNGLETFSQSKVASDVCRCGLVL